MTRPLSVALAAVVAAAAVASTASPQTPTASPGLAVALERALADPGIDRSRTAALAVDLRTDQVVFETNRARGLAPASAEKLAVSFAALRVLGPGFRFHTEVVGEGELTGGVWRGDLYVVGYGDPTLRLADVATLARRVVARGVRRITGRVVGDETHFDTRRVAPGWRPSFLGLESAPLSALSVRGAKRRGANGSAAAAALALTAALRQRGVAVAGAPRAGRAPADVEPLAVVASEPLAAIARRMNTDSDNFVSEMVLKELGATVASPGSTAAGATVVHTELAEAGVPVANVRIVDGSGLSSLDRLTAQALVAILVAGLEDAELGELFVRSLAVAGVSGTLEDRLERRPTRGRVRAKTGTTRRASALVGFVGRRYAFAIVQNGSPVPFFAARTAQDRFVTLLARS